MSKFDQILQTLSGIADEDRAALVALVAKYPDLDKAVVPAVDHQAALTKAEKDHLAFMAWNDWAYGKKAADGTWIKQPMWDSEHLMTVKQLEAERELVSARAKIAEMEAGFVPGAGGAGGGDVDFNQIKAELDKLGYVKADSLSGYAKKDELLPEIDKRVNGTAGNLEFFFTRSAHYPAEYRDEFKERMDMNAFMAFVTSNGVKYVRQGGVADGPLVANFDEAYKDFTAPKRQAADAAKLEADRKKFDEEKAAFEARKVAPSPTDANINDGGVIPAFQRQIQGLDKDAKPLAADAQFGSQVLAAQIAEKYAAGGYPGTSTAAKPN